LDNYFSQRFLISLKIENIIPIKPAIKKIVEYVLPYITLIAAPIIIKSIEVIKIKM